MTDSVDLDAAQRLADAATPGPWSKRGAWIDGAGYDEVLSTCPVECMNYCYGGYAKPEWDREADLDFIVAARSLVPALIAELAEARQRADQLDDQATRLAEWNSNQARTLAAAKRINDDLAAQSARDNRTILGVRQQLKDTQGALTEIRKALDSRWSSATGASLGYGSPEHHAQEFRVIEVEIVRDILDLSVVSGTSSRALGEPADDANLWECVCGHNLARHGEEAGPGCRGCSCNQFERALGEPDA